MKFLAKNIEETNEVAKDFFSVFINKHNSTKDVALVVGLYGDLGAGKTAFTQAIARSFKIKSKISSPTFVIIKRYDLKDQFFDNLFHIDAYRLENESELFALGWKEIISNPKNLVFIEWPERVIGAIPKEHNHIHISHTKEGYRIFNIKKF